MLTETNARSAILPCRCRPPVRSLTYSSLYLFDTTATWYTVVRLMPKKRYFNQVILDAEFIIAAYELSKCYYKKHTYQVPW